MSAPSSVDFAAASPACERYGLRLVDGDESPAAPAAVGADDARPLRPFEWGLLAGFAAVQIGYLAALGVLARWAVSRLIEL